MPTEKTNNYGVRGRPRTAEGKKQLLLLMPADVIKALKIAAVEDDLTASSIAETAIREWLGARKPRKL